MYQFIDGKRRSASGQDRCDNVNPANGEVIDSIDLADASDVDAAVAAASAAQPEWGATPPAARSSVLHRLAAIIADRTDEWAKIESAESGKPIRLASEADLPFAADVIDFFAGAARHLEGKAAAEYTGEHTSYVRRDPVGVIGAITPWNFPLMMAVWKAGPALAAGNSLVIKPSELTPSTTLLLAEAAVEAGLPNGVFNVVTGSGPVAGEALIGHPDVAMIGFTGSSQVGQRVMEIASGRNARLSLELGGKAPFVVFDDADLEAAVHGAVAGALNNGGQDCTAATRAYIQRPLYNEFVRAVAALMDGVKLGPTSDYTTDLGPMVSVAHRDRVAAAVDGARSRGATIAAGGSVPDGPLATGAYYRPTLITDVEQSDPVVQEEIFGPVLVVQPFDRDDDGFALANDTRYGLAASAWTTNVYRASRASRELKAGCVYINDHLPITPEMPHGGIGASGFGKDMSSYAFDEYTVVRHVMYENTGIARKDWHRTVFTL